MKKACLFGFLTLAFAVNAFACGCGCGKDKIVASCNDPNCPHKK